MLQFELFAACPTPPEILWGIVGDLNRLPEWTDASGVEAPPDQPRVNDRFITLHGDHHLEWTVITAEPMLLEAKADTACGRVGLGARVSQDPAGSRLVLAGMLKPSVGRLRARTIELPRLRRRGDEWSARAVRLAVQEANPGS